MNLTYIFLKFVKPTVTLQLKERTPIRMSKKGIPNATTMEES
jgi:hypothetical protein